MLEEKRQEEGIKNQKERREKKCIEEGEGVYEVKRKREGREERRKVCRDHTGRQFEVLTDRREAREVEEKRKKREEGKRGEEREKKRKRKENEKNLLKRKD